MHGRKRKDLSHYRYSVTGGLFYENHNVIVFLRTFTYTLHTMYIEHSVLIIQNRLTRPCDGVSLPRLSEDHEESLRFVSNW